MATDVGHMVRVLNNIERDQTTKLVTRDLLGESFSSSSSNIDHFLELDLALQVPAGWEKRLDLKSGKVYLQKCCSVSESNLSATRKTLQSIKHPSIKRPLNIMGETILDLTLESNSVTSTKTNNQNSCSYESVCSLDKVRSALERVKHEQLRRVFSPRSSKSPSTSSTSTKVTLEFESDQEAEDERNINSNTQQQEGLLTAAGCSNCLMYVMISNEKQKCPKCNSKVSLPVMKKPRIDLDLNISI